jgi:hypothetical protein|tara:strand:- start:91602 stop:92324 length:723 start_codon:yes stop_codon:yes gene_type:complete
MDVRSEKHGNTIKDVYVSNVKRGDKIVNPLEKSVYGVGYLGEGAPKYVTKLKSYWMWKNMLQRCYFTRSDSNNSKYIEDVVVCEEWHCFHNFDKWFNENYPSDKKGINFELDKDMHYITEVNYKGKKEYSPLTCVFLPKNVNNALVCIDKRLRNRESGVFRKGKKYKISMEKDIYFKFKEDAIKVKITESYLKVKTLLVENKDILKYETSEKLKSVLKLLIDLHKEKGELNETSHSVLVC